MDAPVTYVKMVENLLWVAKDFGANANPTLTDVTVKDVN